MALWGGVSQSDHASARVGSLISSRLIPGVKNYGVVDSKLILGQNQAGNHESICSFIICIGKTVDCDLEKFWDCVSEILLKIVAYLQAQ